MRDANLAHVGDCRMLKKSITAIAAATVLTIGVMATMPASAQQRNTQPAHTIMNPNDVWVGKDFAGRDPDPNVRLEIRRTYGQSE